MTKHGRNILEIHEERKVCGHLVLDCTRSSCADWLSSKPRSRGHCALNNKTKYDTSFGGLSWTSLNRKGRLYERSLF